MDLISLDHVDLPLALKASPLLGAAAGVFANLLHTGVCRKAFSRSD
jgi:hypothetical protein